MDALRNALDALQCSGLDGVAIVDPSRSLMIDATDAFCNLVGLSSQAVVEAPFPSVIFSCVPKAFVGRTDSASFASFCQTCASDDVEMIGEVSSFILVPDDCFGVHFTLSKCGPFVICLALDAKELCQVRRVVQNMRAEFAERAKSTLSVVRRSLSESCCDLFADAASSAPGCFCDRLQSQSVLRNGGWSIARAEPDEVSTGCLVFGQTPIIPSSVGICFALRVDKMSTRFLGAPTLGFTRSVPSDRAGLYPRVAKGLAQSILVGDGVVSARDQEEHFECGYKLPPQAEIQTWSCDTFPILSVGDIIDCKCTWKGRVQLLVNGMIVVDLDIGRTLHAESSYYPVVDVSFGVAGVSLLPSPCNTTSARCTESVTRRPECMSTNSDAAGGFDDTSTTASGLDSDCCGNDSGTDASLYYSEVDACDSVYSEDNRRQEQGGLHIDTAKRHNWNYVGLAAIVGLAAASAWRRTQSVTA